MADFFELGMDSLRLDWYFFRGNNDDLNSVNKP